MLSSEDVRHERSRGRANRFERGRSNEIVPLMQFHRYEAEATRREVPGANALAIS